MGIMFTMPQAIEESVRDQKIELIKPAAEATQKTRRRSLEMIVAIGLNGEIGVGGDMVWHIREDLKRFKTLTMGHPLIMGRRTWESLPKRPLPGRRNVVISRNADYPCEGAELYPSLEEAVQSVFETDPATPMVIGGGQIYSQAMPHADTLHITRILAECPEADTYFPAIDEAEWHLSVAEPEQSTPEGLKYRYETWKRRES